MTRSTKIYFLAVLILISTTIGYAIMTKYSFTGDYNLSKIREQYDLENFMYSNNEESIYFNNSINSLDELEKNSDLIVKVQSLNDSILFYNSIETPVKIIDIYSSNDNLKKGDIIYIQEPVSISYLKNMENITSIRGYVLMNPDQEYILFLKHLDKVDGYKYKNNEEITYLPVSTRFGKYCKEESPKYIDPLQIDSGEIYYRDFKNSSAVFIDNEELMKYNSVSLQVYDKYY